MGGYAEPLREKRRPLQRMEGGAQIQAGKSRPLNSSEGEETDPPRERQAWHERREVGPRLLRVKLEWEVKRPHSWLGTGFYPRSPLPGV